MQREKQHKAHSVIYSGVIFTLKVTVTLKGSAWVLVKMLVFI